MHLRMELKKYVVVQLQLPNVWMWAMVNDTDSLEEALLMANREQGQIVLEVPDGARMADGSNFVFNNQKKIVELKS